MDLTIEIFVGENATSYIEEISKLRIGVFKEFPYLYQGDLNYEKKYICGYTSHKYSMIAIAKVDGILAGVSTGIPLMSDSDIVADAKKIFAREHIDIHDYYYYGELIVLPKYRGLGIAKKIFDAQDKKIKAWGFKHACFLTVVREHDHPLRPVNYENPDKLWENLGYHRNHLTIEYHWPTIQADQSIKDVNNTLEFWIKTLHKKIG